MAKKTSENKTKREIRQDVNWGDIIVFPLLAGLMTIALFFYNPIAGVLGLIASVFLTYFAYSKEKESQKRVIRTVENLDMDFDEITKNAVFGMPFPMGVLNERGEFLWYNSTFKSVFSIEGSLLGKTYQRIFPDIALEDLSDTGTEPFRVKVDHSIFLFYNNVTETNNDEKLILLYGVDNTEDEKIRLSRNEERMVVWTVYFDNYDEIRAKTAEQDRPLIFARIDRMINKYAQQYNAFVVKYESDRYIIIMEYGEFAKAEGNNFQLLEDVKSIQLEDKLNPTLSVGIGLGDQSPGALHQEARAAIDIALSRGGDQVVMKEGEELRYHGGKNQATQKFTKVKARVMANAISQFIDESKDVFIMGHKNPDMDSFGSCLGMLALAKNRGVNAYIVLDEVTPAIDNLYNKAMDELDDLEKIILTPDQALDGRTDRSLIMVLDNHRHDSTACPDLLDTDSRVIIIDHHRRGGDYIKDAVISYIEPYASSTSELVTELLTYDDEDFKLPQVIAEGLLAGITVDTKNFYYQTGVRTFEAAAILKRHGADSITIKELFKDEFALVQYKSQIIAQARYFDYDTIISSLDQEVKAASLIASQAADELLDIRGVEASFVLTPSNGKIHISARSLGNVSVQLIMEKLQGGGHLTSAATQIDTDMETAEDLLKKAITEYFKEEEDNESDSD